MQALNKVGYYINIVSNPQSWNMVILADGWPCYLLFLLLCFLLPQITVSVEGLPSLSKEEAYSCFFHDTESSAVLTNTGVVCSTPNPDSLPPISYGDGMQKTNEPASCHSSSQKSKPCWQLICFSAEFVVVTLSLRFLNVTVAETEFTFYNCSLVQQLSGRRPWVHTHIHPNIQGCLFGFLHFCR